MSLAKRLLTRGQHGLSPLLLLPLMVCIGGCGDDGRVPLFPAEGRVLVDGQPVAGVEIRLYPADQVDDVDALRPYATSGTDGGFRLGTYEKEDGAPEGRFKVTVYWLDPESKSATPDDLLGGQYADASKPAQEVTIEQGKNQLPTIEVKKRATRPSRSRPTQPDMDGVN